jgi:hypothetical protein
MSKRLNLFLPDDHWILEIPPGDRGKRIRELLEIARKTETLVKDVAEIKSLLISGTAIIPAPPKQSKTMDDADRDLILNMLGM